MKMKKRILTILFSIITLSLLICVLSGCELFKKKTDEAAEKYTIIYFDGKEQKQITVTTGKIYSIDIPQAEDGMEFAGLFDAQEGGVQYVSKVGICLAHYNENRDIVLYAQFVPKKYTLILDYEISSAWIEWEWKNPKPTTNA